MSEDQVENEFSPACRAHGWCISDAFISDRHWPSEDQARASHSLTDMEMSGRHGRCPVHSRCSENAGGPPPLTGRNVGWTFTANWDCKSVAPVWATEFELLACIYKLGDSTPNPHFQLYFESSWVLATVVCIAHSAPLGWGRCGCPHRGTGAVPPGSSPALCCPWGPQR